MNRTIPSVEPPSELDTGPRPHLHVHHTHEHRVTHRMAKSKPPRGAHEIHHEHERHGNNPTPHERDAAYTQNPVGVKHRPIG